MNVSITHPEQIANVTEWLRRSGRDIENVSPWEWHCLCSRFALMGYTQSPRVIRT